jgi:hypothetical protein
MQYGHIEDKQLREYLRASETLLTRLQNQDVCNLSSYELLIMKVHNERMRSAIVQIENTKLLRSAHETLAGIKAEPASS